MNACIVIAAYNAEQYIGQAVESALLQTKPAREVVIVDDCSEDSTVGIASTYEPRVRVLRNGRNLGPAVSRNRGVQETESDFIVFLDADDLMCSNHIAVMTNIVEKWSTAGIVASGVEMFSDDDSALCEYWRLERCLDKPGWLFEDAMRGLKLLSGNHVFQRSAFEKVGGYRSNAKYFKGRRIQVEDNELFYRMSINNKVVGSPEITIKYRLHAQQASAETANQQLLQTFKVRADLLTHLKAVNGELAGRGRDRLQRDWEETMDEFRSHRNNKDLCRLIWFGLNVHTLRSTTLVYLFDVMNRKARQQILKTIRKDRTPKSVL